MQLFQSARWLVPALLLSAVSPFTYAGALPGVPVALRIFPAMAQPQAGKDASAAAQTPTGENPPAKKHRFTLNVNGMQVGVGSTTKKQTTTTTKPATDSPNTSAAPTTAGTPPQQQGLSTTAITGISVDSAADSQAQVPVWDGDIKKPITFRWMPVVPKPKDLAGYRVAVWQLQQGQTGPQAFRANQPIITKDVDSISITQAIDPNFITGTCRRPALCSYVWSVQALDKKGRPVGVNGGIVSMAAFRYEPGATATRGTPLIVVDGNQPAAPGIFDRWGELYAEAGEGAPGRNGGQRIGSLAGTGIVTNTSNPAQLATGGQQQKPQPRNDERFTATVNDPARNDDPIGHITITLPTNPDAYTVNWGDGDGTNKFSIEAVGPAKDARGMGRLYGGVDNSRILVIIKKGGGGQMVCGGQTSFGAVQGGFAPASKVWSGKSAAAMLGQGCNNLPPGDYELAVQVVGTQGGTDVALSALAIKPFTIRGNDQQAYQPPQGIDPATTNVEAVTVVNNGAPGSPSNIEAAHIEQPITFRWTPVATKPNDPATYRVQVFEILPGQDPMRAIKANQPILTKLTDEPQLGVTADMITGPCKPPYACDYVWTVQALNREGKPIGSNNGTSELASFSYDPRGGTFAERQPGGGNEYRKKGGYTMGLSISFDAVQPARAGGPQPRDVVVVGYGTQQKADTKIQNPVLDGHSIKTNTPIITKDLDHINPNDVETYSDANRQTRGAANGVIIVTTKKGKKGKSANTTVPVRNPNVQQNPGYLSGTWNVAEGYTGTAVQPASKTGAQGRINPAVEEGRSVATPGSGTGKPQPADNPITAINITLPANPDAVKKDANTANWGTGTSKPSAVVQTPNQKGKAPETFTVTNTGGSTTGALDTSPQKAQQPGQARDTLWNPATNQNGKAVPHATVTPSQGTPIPIEHDPDGMAAHGNTNGSNGKAAPHETVTPSSSTPIPIEHDPDGIAARGKTNGGAAPQAKPAKKKSKIGIHVVF